MGYSAYLKPRQLTISEEGIEGKELAHKKRPIIPHGLKATGIPTF